MTVSAAPRRCDLCVSDTLCRAVRKKSKELGKDHLSNIKQLGGANTRRSFAVRFRAARCRVAAFFFIGRSFWSLQEKWRCKSAVCFREMES
jgi:hypothetical protein